MVEKTEAVGGVIITASHNPVSDSGIKVFDSFGFKTSPSLEIEISELEVQEYHQVLAQEHHRLQVLLEE